MKVIFETEEEMRLAGQFGFGSALVQIFGPQENAAWSISGILTSKTAAMLSIVVSPFPVAMLKTILSQPQDEEVK